MPANKQLKKLQRVLRFYEQELKIVEAEFAIQNTVVGNLIQQLTQQTRKLENDKHRFSQCAAKIENLQLANQLMIESENRIDSTRINLANETDQLAIRRQKLLDQLAKIESLKRLVERKCELNNYLATRTEQTEHDDQYLITNFGKSK